MPRFLLLALALFCTLSVSQAQRTCETMPYLEQQIKQDPERLQRLERIEEYTQQYLAKAQPEKNQHLITIPVVVHVVWNTASENISDAQVQSQITVLNQDFRVFTNAIKTKWQQADDTEIEFCLATVDPSGNPTNGINRVQTSVTSFSGNDAMKFSPNGADAWPATSYLNIWVCDLGSNLLGYAQFPGGAAATDGVVIDYAYFGTIGTATPPFHLGRTATHEVGHWLNLRHIWGDGPCRFDDGVSDTPESDAANYGCPTSHVSCRTLDMVENYMDYTDDACMGLFTLGQKNRMRAVFSADPMRAALLNSAGCGGDGGGGEPSCSNEIQDGNETGVDCGGSSCPPCDPEPGVCEAPDGLSTTPQNGKRQTLSWNSAAGAQSYTVAVRLAGTSTWQTFSSNSTSITIRGFTDGATYEWQVTSHCAGDATATSTLATFVAGQSSRTAAPAGLSVFPNPARDVLYVNLAEILPTGGVLSLGAGETAEADIRLSILDATGRRLRSLRVTAYDTAVQLNISDLAHGLYFMRAEALDGELLGTARFVISR